VNVKADIAITIAEAVEKYCQFYEALLNLWAFFMISADKYIISDKCQDQIFIEFEEPFEVKICLFYCCYIEKFIYRLIK
jgi:hypothetical protein